MDPARSLAAEGKEGRKEGKRKRDRSEGPTISAAMIVYLTVQKAAAGNSSLTKLPKLPRPSTSYRIIPRPPMSTSDCPRQLSEAGYHPSCQHESTCTSAPCSLSQHVYLSRRLAARCEANEAFVEPPALLHALLYEAFTASKPFQPVAKSNSSCSIK